MVLFGPEIFINLNCVMGIRNGQRADPQVRDKCHFQFPAVLTAQGNICESWLDICNIQ